MADNVMAARLAEEQVRFAPIVADALAHFTGAPVEVVGDEGSTRPPASLPAVRVRLRELTDRYATGTLAEVVIYSDQAHPLDFDPSAHVHPGHHGSLKGGRLVLDHGEVSSMRARGNSHRATLADGTTATVHRLLFGGVIETIPTMTGEVKVGVQPHTGIFANVADRIANEAAGLWGDPRDVAAQVEPAEIIATAIDPEGIRTTTLRGRLRVWNTGRYIDSVHLSQVAGSVPSTFVGELAGPGRVVEVRQVENSKDGRTFDFICKARVPNPVIV